MFSSMLHYHFTLHWEGTVQQELWLNNRFHDDIYVGRKLLLSSPPSPPPHPSVHCFTKILKFLCSDLLLPSLAFTPFSSVITGIFIFTPLQSFLRFKMPARRYRKSFGPKKKLPFYFLANKKQIQDRVLRKIWLTKQELLNHKAAEAFSPTLPPQTHTATPSTQTFFVHTPPNHSSEQKPTIPEGGREGGVTGRGRHKRPLSSQPSQQNCRRGRNFLPHTLSLPKIYRWCSTTTFKLFVPWWLKGQRRNTCCGVHLEGGFVFQLLLPFFFFFYRGFDCLRDGLQEKKGLGSKISLLSDCVTLK